MSTKIRDGVKALTVLGLLLQLGCSGTSDEEGAEPLTQSLQPEPPAAPSAACPSGALGAGEHRVSLMHGGRSRAFIIYVPRGYDNARHVPLVVNYHGATSNAVQQQRTFSQMNPKADKEGFVVVYPDGVGNSWNAGACCGEAQSAQVDDVDFTRALVGHVKEKLCIDPNRIYATGFSNGGRMAYRLGCELADIFAAIAPVAGTKSFPDLNGSSGCKPVRPVSLIDFMGTADPRIEAQPRQVSEWARLNECKDQRPRESYRKGRHFCATYAQCKEGTRVTYCVVAEGGHCWPGSYPCLLGNTSRPEELSANDLMWDLFEQSAR